MATRALQNLAPLLNALGSPESPAFNQALQELEQLDPSTLNPAEVPQLLALLETTMNTLHTKRDSLGTELGKIRTINQALRAYQR
jgi:hypothetical protein